ncbi:hypothetical protein QJQ45_029475 [Haematococcus lacustris]|nr:hypothetical protein QJQ45_029475 [Haematococcus lacustris]
MSVAGEQQPIGNQRLAPVQTTRAVVAAMRRSPALPIPRVLQSPVIAAAAAAARADGTTVVGAVPAPKVELKQMSQTRFASLYDMLQSALGNDERSRAITAVLDCQDFWATNEWLVGTLAPAAKLVEALQADSANLAHVHFGLMAVEGALDRTTRRDEAMELEQLWSDRMEYGHHDALYLAAALDPNFRDKHDTLTTDQLRAAEDLAARLASADGRGSDSAADQVGGWYIRVKAPMEDGGLRG